MINQQCQDHPHWFTMGISHPQSMKQSKWQAIDKLAAYRCLPHNQLNSIKTTVNHIYHDPIRFPLDSHSTLKLSSKKLLGPHPKPEAVCPSAAVGPPVSSCCRPWAAAASPLSLPSPWKQRWARREGRSSGGRCWRCGWAEWRFYGLWWISGWLFVWMLSLTLLLPALLLWMVYGCAGRGKTGGFLAMWIF